MEETLEARLSALERAVTDGEHDLATLTADAEAAETLDRLDDRVDEMDDRLSELEAATQALRGYVGNVRAVNEDVRERADLALEAVESLDETTSHDPEQVERGDTDADPRLELETDARPGQPRTDSDGKGPGSPSAGHGRDVPRSPSAGQEKEMPRSPSTGHERDTHRSASYRDTTTATEPDQSCPLCDGTERSQPDSGPTDSEDWREGVTDGGVEPQSGESTDDPTLLRRVRELL